MSVHRLDLRGLTRDESRKTVRAVFGPGTPPTDSARALVLDETGRLVDHADSYEDIFNSGRVQTMVCVAVGPPERTAARRTLNRPGQIGPERGIATLWVDDETGVGWTLHPPGPASPFPGAVPESRIGADRLVEVLSHPEVFDRVVELSGELPEAAASPGLYWVGAESGEDAVTAALLRAAFALTAKPSGSGSSAPTATARSSGSPLVDLVEGVRRPSVATDDPGNGELAARERRLRHALGRADGSLESLSGWLGVFGTASPARLRASELPAVGAALADYRDYVVALFTRLNTLTGEPLAAELARAGIAVRPVPPEESREAVDALRRRAESRLARGGAVTEVAADLDRVAAHVSPPGSAAEMPRVRHAVPSGLVDALEDPPGFPAPGPVSGLLAAAFAAPLFPALAGWWTGALAGGLLAALWLVMFAVLLARCRPLRGAAPTLAVHAGAAVGGVLAGLWIGAASGLSVELGPPVVVLVGSVVGGVVAAWSLAGSWTARIRAWRSSIPLDAVDPAASGLTRLVNAVARDEWALGAARRHLADLTRSAAGATRAATHALTEATERLPTPATPPAEASDLVPVLRADLTSLVRTAVAPIWSGLRAGQVRDLYDSVHDGTSDLVAEYLQHLRTEGPYVPPRFVAPGEERTIAVSGDPERLLRALHRPPGDRMLQLCDPAHLSLLSTGAGAARGVRFAPMSVRPAMFGGGREAPSDTVWTAGGRLTGLLRLVPLRSGVMTTLWSNEPPGDEAPVGVPDPLSSREAVEPEQEAGRSEPPGPNGARDRAEPPGEDARRFAPGPTQPGGSNEPIGPDGLGGPLPSEPEEDYLR
ncbi:hypothetical protein [Nocardiopsis rhodophaea]|uniref:hypothetical protein n=1 Tax=Nocardiopsis rhodophaea TaxID=280238 RepID=UPI0031E1A57E